MLRWKLCYSTVHLNSWKERKDAEPVSQFVKQIAVVAKKGLFASACVTPSYIQLFMRAVLGELPHFPCLLSWGSSSVADVRGIDDWGYTTCEGILHMSKSDWPKVFVWFVFLGSGSASFGLRSIYRLNTCENTRQIQLSTFRQWALLVKRV